MKRKPFSKNRELIGDQLERARNHHLCVSCSYEFDVTEVLPALECARARGLPVTIVSAMVWATGQLLRKQPRLNRHCFKGWFRRYEVDFEEVSCTLVVARQSTDGEAILLPLLLRNVDRMTLLDVGRAMQDAKTAPLESMPQFAAMEKIKHAPLWKLRWFNYKARTDPKFYIRYFGTYGVSSNLVKGFGPVGAHTLANTGCSFLPGVLREMPRVVGGQVVPRWILTVLLLVDHYVIDGADMATGMAELRAMLESREFIEKALSMGST